MERDAGLRAAAGFFFAVVFFGARAIRGAPVFGVFTVERAGVFFAGAFFAVVFFAAIRVTSWRSRRSMNARPIEYVIATLVAFVALALCALIAVWYVGGMC